jgi:hypothetical protein
MLISHSIWLDHYFVEALSLSEKSDLSDQNLTAPDGLIRPGQVLVRFHSKGYQGR